MRLLMLVLASVLDLLRVAHGQEFMVTRHIDGDIFTLEGSCAEACTVLSSGTARSLSIGSSTSTLPALNTSCSCQCNDDLPIFREDLQICVNDILECNVAGFLSSSGQIERVPYVFLPQRGQIIYPHAEIRFEGVNTPVCGITGAQQLGKSGWSELKNLSDAEPPFRLFRDEGKTFLQWIGESGLRDAAEGRVVIAKLICRDASPEPNNTGVFTPCVAFRVAGSPSKSNVREITFSSTFQVSQGLSATEYAAIGLSSVILAVIYVASVSLYLHSRKGKKKSIEEAEVTLPGPRETSGMVKNNPLLITSRHLESDTNSALTESELGDDLTQSDGEQNYEHSKYTSAIVHPRYIYMEHSEAVFGSGSMLGERLPEEDVRIVETIDSSHQQEVPVLPGTQRRKLYFNPAYFDRQLLLAPPPAAIEFLLKIREVIAIAKHKISAKKFVPTLVGIPEEDSDLEQNSTRKAKRQRDQGQRPRSITSPTQDSTTKSKKSLRCTGCPGCAEFHRNLLMSPRDEQTNPGESKVRAWLEDVKPTSSHWHGKFEQTQKNFQEASKNFGGSFEYVRELTKCDFPEFNKPTRIFSSCWQENPSIFRTSQNVARSEILNNDDRYSVSKRSTKSMFENFSCVHPSHRQQQDVVAKDAVNEKVRKAIENSFIKQMEENAAIEKETTNEGETKKKEDSKISKEETTNILYKNNTNEREEVKNSKASSQEELPDMINELPGATDTAKRIMDAVIREMVDAKVLEHYPKTPKITDYEVDSLERLKYTRKSSTSPESTDQSSPALSTALPLDEELTIQSAVIKRKTEDMQFSKVKKDVLEKNYYNTLPELVLQRSEAYSLVSEVYVNDGYVSPAGSDDSGPDIRYEPENPGHLTIKVQDSPENYVKQDESEYEPDTLDRKPMKLKINGEINTERETINEVYMDSLERPGQILLKSRGSFRFDDDREGNNNESKLQRRGYGSLREIYEARLRSNLKDSSFSSSAGSLNGEARGDSLSWKKEKKYLTPEKRQAKRQRPPTFNQPDVVPLPPKENIYQCPKPPRPVEISQNNLTKVTRTTQAIVSSSPLSKNGWDRSPVEAGDPTTSNGSPVQENGYNVGYNGTIDCHKKMDVQKKTSSILDLQNRSGDNYKRFAKNSFEDVRQHCRSSSSSLMKDVGFDGGHKEVRKCLDVACLLEKWPNGNVTLEKEMDFDNERSANSITVRCPRYNDFTGENRQNKVEDNGYLSSTDSNSSQKRLLKYEVSSVSETDETESICDGASESGAESIGTDSVFFGNLTRLSSEQRNFPRGVIDVGIESKIKGSYRRRPFDSQNESGIYEKSSFSLSDSETESFVTVLLPDAS